MSITGIVGLKPGYESAISEVDGPHLQCQFMLKKENGKIEPDDKAYIFRPRIYKTKDIKDIEINDIYPSLGPLKVPKNALGMIMFGLQHNFRSEKEILNSMEEFNINEIPTGLSYGAAHIFEIIAPQFFTFAVHLTGEIFKEGVDSRYSHLYKSIDYDLSEDKNLIIKTIKLTEPLYRIETHNEKYLNALASSYIETL